MLSGMTRWYPLEPLDESFFRTAPYVYRLPVELDVPPERVWQSLTSDRALADWGLGLHKLEWTSPRPFGVGTTRTVTFWGGMDVFERFTAWEHGRRLGFTFEGTTELVWRRFAERYDVDDLGDGRCRLTWTVGYEPAGGFGRWHALIRPAMALNFRLYMALLRRYVRGRA